MSRKAKQKTPTSRMGLFFLYPAQSPHAISAMMAKKKKMAPELKGRCRLLTKNRSNLPAKFTTCGMMPQRIIPNSTTEPPKARSTPHSAFDLKVPFLAQSTNRGMVMKIQIRNIHNGGQKKAKKRDMMAKVSTAPMPVASLLSL